MYEHFSYLIKIQYTFKCSKKNQNFLYPLVIKKKQEIFVLFIAVFYVRDSCSVQFATDIIIIRLQSKCRLSNHPVTMPRIRENKTLSLNILWRTYPRKKPRRRSWIVIIIITTIIIDDWRFHRELASKTACLRIRTYYIFI